MWTRILIYIFIVAPFFNSFNSRPGTLKQRWQRFLWCAAILVAAEGAQIYYDRLRPEIRQDSPFVILNVTRQSTPQEISTRARYLKAQFHPDRSHKPHAEVSGLFAKIDDASKILKDRRLRALYDQFGDTWSIERIKTLKDTDTSYLFTILLLRAMQNTIVHCIYSFAIAYFLGGLKQTKNKHESIRQSRYILAIVGVHVADLLLRFLPSTLERNNEVYDILRGRSWLTTVTTAWDVTRLPVLNQLAAHELASACSAVVPLIMTFVNFLGDTLTQLLADLEKTRVANLEAGTSEALPDMDPIEAEQVMLAGQLPPHCSEIAIAQNVLKPVLALDASILYLFNCYRHYYGIDFSSEDMDAIAKLKTDIRLTMPVIPSKRGFRGFVLATYYGGSDPERLARWMEEVEPMTLQQATAVITEQTKNSRKESRGMVGGAGGMSHMDMKPSPWNSLGPLPKFLLITGSLQALFWLLKKFK